MDVDDRRQAGAQRDVVDKREALTYLRDRIEAGQLRVVIDRQYPLEQIVEAHRYVDTGRKRGNVVVTVGR